MHKEASPQKDLTTLSGKYLTFVLGPECYGIPILKVSEIIRLQPITSVPNMPEYLKGVLNLRGKIIPILDLRIRLQLPAEDSELACIIVVGLQSAEGKTAHLGMIVDSVEEVVTVSGSDIDPVPHFGSSIAKDYIRGIAKLKGHIKTLLDIDKLICDATLKEISKGTNT
ncbi:MAG: chemotaxis protein CheW [Verrucomicrobiota bacterium]